MVRVGDQSIELTHDKVLNRLQEWLKHRPIGEKRAKRLNSTIRGIWPYVSEGVHSDVSLHEAQSLTLQTLMMVGEYLEIAALAEDSTIR